MPKITLANKILIAAVKLYSAREKLITEAQESARFVRTASKRAISLTRRGEIAESDTIITEAEKAIEKLKVKIKSDARLVNEGFIKEALEEYVEAKMLLSFLSGKPFSLPDTAAFDPQTIIAGIADSTGELVRRAVVIAHDADAIKELERYRAAIEEFVETLAQAAHSGKLRQKYDETERNLHRLEQLIYELRLRK